MSSSIRLSVPCCISFVAAVLSAACGGSTTGPTTTTVASVTVTPGTDSIVPQQSVQLTAIPRDAGGSAVAGASVSWSVTPAGVVTVNSSGVVTGVAAGTAAVMALSGAKSATATITVSDGGMIGPTGGTITGAGGAAVLIFPAQALGTATPISVQPMAAPPAAVGLVAGAAFDFGPSGTQFAQPVTIKLRYTAGQLPAGADPTQLQLAVRNGDAWAMVQGSTVDVSAQTVTGTTMHFSGMAPCVTPCGIARINVDLNGNNGGAVALGGNYVAQGDLQTLGYYGAVTCRVTGAPTGVTATATPAGSGDYRTYTFAITVSVSAPPGGYQLTITCSATAGSGVPDGSTYYNLTIIAPTYTLVPNPAGLSVAQGDQGTSTVTLVRTLFNGSVTLSAAGMPTGVTATFNPAATTGTSSLLTLNVGSSVTTGNSNITIKGTAAGISDVTTVVGLTVTSGAGFTLAGTPAFASVPHGGSGRTGVQATRNAGFAGTITYGLTGLPAGLSGGVAATSVADSMAVSFIAASGLAAGDYPVVVAGTSGGKTTQVTIIVSVAPPGTTVVHLDYSGCDPSVRPVWVAWQDSTGAFTPVTGTGGVYTFAVNHATAAAAVVTPLTGGGYSTTVLFGGALELSGMPTCTYVPQTEKSLNFSVVGLGVNDFANVSMPWTTTIPQYALPSSTLVGVASGTQDVIAFRYDHTNPTLDIRGIIRRGLNLPNGGTIAPLDFGGSESFVPTQGTLTVQNLNGEQGSASVSYLSQPASCSNYALFMNTASVATSPAIFGFPASAQQPADLHLVSVGTSTRSTRRWVHAFGSQVISLGGALTVPAITTLAGPYKRPQVTVTVPADYSVASYSWGAASGNELTMVGTSGYFGSGTMTLTMPDLSGVAGYNVAAWAPAAASGSYMLMATSALVEACTDGSVRRSARVTGAN